MQRLQHDYGFRPLRAFGSLGVDRVRSHLASKALTTEHEWLFWLDSDMALDPEWAVHLLQTARDHRMTWLAAASVCRGSRDLNIRTLDPAERVVFGSDGRIYEVAKAAVAVAVTHRSLFERLWDRLPPVDYTDDATGDRFEGRPFFWPIVRDRTHYGEDYSLALRAREAGVRLWADTRVPTEHYGEVCLDWSMAKGMERV